MSFVNEEKITCELIEVGGFKTAFHGMRAPMKSYHLADSNFENGVFVCIYNIDSHGEYKWIDKIKIEGAKLI